MNRIIRRRILFTACLACVTAWGIADDKPADSKKPANPAAAQFDQLKKLVGDWTGTFAGEDGQANETTISYRLTAAGSTLVETMAAGTPHEMLTMYHRDGDRVLLTHYCAAGNQPRMRAEASVDLKTIAFKFLDGTNLDPAKDMHMHEATIKFVGDDHIQSEWVHWIKGKAAGAAKFDLKRKKN